MSGTSSSSALLEAWQAASGNPFYPSIAKESQFLVGGLLLSLAFILTIVFTLNRSILAVPLYGLPASIAFGFGAVYMICAVGVYV